ncbi:MAG: DUF642 domain-containing protein [Proteobacteria bacterium]|nr:DUF642 domain-containing protein [Pseudomonadota bacterium]
MKNLIAASGLLGLLALPGIGHANMLVNGSFESPGTGCQAGATTLPGWSVTAGNVDVINAACTGIPAADGTYFLDLTGSFGAGAGAISQTVTTDVGEQYTLSFFFGANAQWQQVAGNPYSIYANDGSVKSMNVLVDGSQLGGTYSIDTTGQAWNSAGWIYETTTFTASSTQTQITFQSLNGADGTVYGPLLDGVQLQESSDVPEPPTASLMVAGLLAVLYMTRRLRLG